MERLLIPIEKIKLIFHYKDRTVQRLKGKEFILGYALLFTALLIAFSVYELKTSRFQAYFLNKIAKDMKFWVEPGKSSSVRFPKEGPYDNRLGYVYLPAFIDRLTAKGYEIEAQARFSKNLAEITERGFFTTFHEKTQAGLQIMDRDNNVMFEATYPERIYNDFNEVPDVMVKSLLFIENKELLNPQLPYLNPAVEWDRLAKAVLFKGRHLIDRDERVPGGSTLATQMEKYRHSPNGLTSSVRDKYRQMTSAALRAYINGEQNIEVRHRIVLDYINSMPLGAVPGYGQVNGMGDGLYAWYNADFNYINNCLKSSGKNQGDTNLIEWALAYKQVLSMFLAQRRPSFYLLENHNALEAKADSYIRLLAENGIISPRERDAALQTRLTMRQYMPAQRKSSFIERKAANAIRPMLLSLLKVPGLYDQDLLDLTVKSSLDYRAQEEVTDILRKLSEPEFTKAAGLSGPHMLGNRNPANIIYSFTLYERTPGANLLRIQTDNFDQPFNINEGVKLELGSTAKLRTLITYLEIIAALHNRYSSLSDEQLKAVYIPGTDQLSKWAVDYLSKSDDKSLQSMLKAAMERQYSASPAEHFFTGGGEHTFSNFDNKYNYRVVSVREAFQNSVNLVFIRIMRDIVRYYTFQRPGIAELFEDIKDPRRQVYLERFADREGKIFIKLFYSKYKGKSFEDALGILLQGIRPAPSRLADIFRSVKPEAGIEEFTSFMRSRLQNSTLTDNAFQKLYEDYALGNYPLVDRGYIAHVHPLELWTVAYMRNHPDVSRSEIIEVSKNERQEVYTWLFKTHWKNAQDLRIRTLLEVEAFSEIHRAWKNLGYPFDSLVPSYATAIGSSADRPDALAELAGIVLNNGVLYPSRRIQELHFAKDTPYETIIKRQTEKGERVLLPEIANAVKDAMIGVVEKGTAHSMHRAFTGSDGKMIVIGGKTGTGDNRHDIYGTGGRLIKSEAINRTAVFVFLLGDRFFGTITAYVAGNEADNYTFTSLLPVQVLKTLAPKLMPLIERADTEDQVRIARNDAKRIM
ncbi:MAG: transglycosylase domain-containing protein [Nitrospirae bacterium]|nr:transglycosylase domain-containing protein [Nitrospirota bacterium]